MLQLGVENLMSFEDKFNKIKTVVKQDLDNLEQQIAGLFSDENPLSKDLTAFLTAPSKRLRPMLGFLFINALFGKLNEKQREVLLAVELIHSATLIHDDVIDEAETRRTQETLNVKFNDNLAVVAGDYLLSVAMEKVINTGSIEVIKLCTSALKSTCMGEINQYFAKFNITSIEDYVVKSKEKTALLFEIAVLSPLLLNENEIDETTKQKAIDFSQNFGIAFQVRDDLINVLHSGNDTELGIYTAPVIFAYQENKNIIHEKNIADAIQSTKGIEKTKDLMDNYFNKSVSAIEGFKNNSYKQAMVALVDLLRENL